jgi:hypothetical protein
VGRRRRHGQGHGDDVSATRTGRLSLRLARPSSGTLRYMISYMIAEDNDIDYDIICFVTVDDIIGL